MGINGGPAPYMTDDIVTMYYVARKQYGKDADLEWRVGHMHWHTLRNLKAGDGSYLWCPGIGTASPVTLMGCPIRLADTDSITIVPHAAIGMTERLAPRRCRECGDEAPSDAVYCIACGAPVQ